MSKLKRLIQKFCSNGVEYKSIGEISSFRRGSFPQPYGNKEWYDGIGAMPFVQVADIGENMRLVDDTKRKISVLAQKKSVFAPKGSIIISLQGSIGRVAITQYDSYIDRTVAIFDNLSDEIFPKYFAYQLQRIFSIKEKFARGSTIKTITKEEFTSFEIPVPPLEVQCEIGRILDSFTEHTEELTEELTKELTARKQQYEYYRDKFIQFDKDVKIKSLSEIAASYVDGMHSLPQGVSEKGDYPILSAKNINNGNIDLNTSRFVTEKVYDIENKRTNVKNGDVLLTIVGAIGRVAVVKNDDKMLFQRSVCIIKPKSDLILSDYLKYVLESTSIQDYIQSNAHGAAQKGIYLNQVGKIKIPIPSLDVQNRIVNVLDNFDSICSDFNIGLLAEIEAREKQYEYYRDKLLSFKEINV